MKLPREILSFSPEEGARRVALARLEAAGDAAARLEDPDDATALHDFRVALRRLRSTLRAWRGPLGKSASKPLRHALRRIQRATSEGRDAEVALAWIASQRASLAPPERQGLTWIAKRMEERHGAESASARNRARLDFESTREPLQRGLEVLTLEMHLDRHRPGRRFAGAITTRTRADVRRLARRLGRVGSSEDCPAAHRARIAAKHLRYLLEPLRGRAKKARVLVERCKELQDILGELHDAHVLRGILGREEVAASSEYTQQRPALVQDGDTEALRRAERESPLPGLLELTRRVQARIDASYTELRDVWLGKPLEAFLAEIERFARGLDERPAREVEIERKYLLRALPPLGDDVARIEIEQGWLPGAAVRERLRRQRGPNGTRYFRTVKLGQGVQRTEIEEPTTREVFELLWPLTEGCRIRKRRHVVREGARAWEIDEFLDRELLLAEIELADPAEHPDLPAWLAPHVEREVTDDPRYTNLSLAREHSA